MDEDRAREARCELVERLRSAGRLRSDDVARAIERVPRHRFVPEPARDRSYEDRPLEIGEDQVVTAPHLVAQMTELLDPEPDKRVLEVGTGSGYHAAVLAELVGAENVFTIERFPTLAGRARDALAESGYDEVAVIVGDGSRGLPGAGPFERINVTAVAPEVPGPLLEQLADPGRMVLPLGPRDGPHELWLVEKRDGDVERTPRGGVRFVPLVGERGFDE